MAGPRVLVVDDSAFTRKVLRESLTEAGIEVVGVARDGLEALEKITQLHPDVLTLDLVMPNLDGVGVMRALAGRPDAPRVVLVSISDADSDLAVEAFTLGAVELVRKPTGLANQRLFEIARELVSKVHAAHLARPAPLPAGRPAPAPTRASAHALRQLVVVGASTGGPQAITRLLTDLPADFPVPLAIALHIPAGYTASLAARLDQSCALRVEEARDGLELRPGLAVLARGGEHLLIEKGRAGAPWVRLAVPGEGHLHVPSVDLLFESAARAVGPAALGVVLTGMGDDGLRGARAIHAAGGALIAEAESSCVVYGMPRCVSEAGLAAAQVPLGELAAEVLRRA